MDTNTEQPKQANYRPFLDAPLGNKARRIAVSLLTAHSPAEVIEDTGATHEHIQQTIGKPAVQYQTTRALTEKTKKLDAMLEVLQDIIDKEPETPLKYSDKLKAIELSAKLSGITEDKGDTYNVGIFDLREATEDQLVKELARYEERKRNAIDTSTVE